MMGMDLASLMAILPHIKSIEHQIGASLADSIAAMLGGSR